MTKKPIPLAPRFMALFAGLPRAHGVYRMPEGAHERPGEKIEGKASTIREPVTLAKWEAHLTGALGLGIIPIRDNATVRWGAIDIDVYKGMDLPALERTIHKIKLPLVLCRSKSGGAHLFLFLSEDTPAEAVRTRLMDWAIALGHPNVEVFPKQTRLAGTNDVGNWINMPYFGPESSRHGLQKGKPLAPEKFLSLAEGLQISPADLDSWVVAPADPKVATLLEEAPPCLQVLAATGGFGEGSRNNALFNLGVYLRKRFGKDYAAQMDEYNRQLMKPPLESREVIVVSKDVGKKVYEYLCREQPIAAVCNRQICLTRKFGVGAGAEVSGMTYGSIVMINTQPPTWIWDVDGARIELTTEELMTQRLFQKRCVEVLKKWPRLMKLKDWTELVREKINLAEVIQPPPGATPEDTVLLMLHAYVTKTGSPNQDELLIGKPYFQNGKVFFNAGKFREYLLQRRIHMTEKQVFNHLRKVGLDKKFFNIKGRGINTWVMPMTEEPEAMLPVPDLPPLTTEDL